MEKNNSPKMIAGPTNSGTAGSYTAAKATELTVAQKARIAASKTVRTTDWNEVEEFLSTSPIVGYLQAAGDPLG